MHQSSKAPDQTNIRSQPRREAEASGSPLKGGRLREVAPLGTWVSCRPGLSPSIGRSKSRKFGNRESGIAFTQSSPSPVVWILRPGSLKALRVARPEAVGLARTKCVITLTSVNKAEVEKAHLGQA
jgi:hypothetical protein